MNIKYERYACFTHLISLKFENIFFLLHKSRLYISMLEASSYVHILSFGSYVYFTIVPVYLFCCCCCCSPGSSHCHPRPQPLRRGQDPGTRPLLGDPQLSSVGSDWQLKRCMVLWGLCPHLGQLSSFRFGVYAGQIGVEMWAVPRSQLGQQGSGSPGEGSLVFIYF